LEAFFNSKVSIYQLIKVGKKMGRCTVTKGQRGIGRTIRKLEGSVELSSKESVAKVAESSYKEKAQKSLGIRVDSPVQNLRDSSKWKKDEADA